MFFIYFSNSLIRTKYELKGESGVDTAFQPIIYVAINHAC